MIAAAAGATIDAFIQEEREAYLSLPKEEKDRNYLTLQERMDKVEKEYQRTQDDIKWQMQLQYAENIQGAFFGHVITDRKVE